jgi:hypothetical protein
MDWLYIVARILAIVVVALLLGWSEKRVKSPGATVFIWIGSILLLCIAAGWGVYILLFLALVLHMVDSLPPFVAWVVFGSIVFLFFEYRFRVTAAAVLEVLAEVEKTNARMELLENSVRDKLDDTFCR